MAAQREFAFSDQDFQFIADLMHRRAGILLGAQKRDLVYGRLARRLRALGLRSFAAYCDLLRSGADDGEIHCMINALTTNLTAFFRESHHFAHLREVALPETVARGERRIRIWSSACSTGEEPYSIAMVALADGQLPRQHDLRILATDLDSTVLATATRGVYGEDAAGKVPPALRQRFLAPCGSGRLEVREPLRQLTCFKQLNLLGDWPMQGRFDVIFCRNVMIYFDAEAKARLIERFIGQLRPGGWLYLGHSETLTGQHRGLVLADRTVYRREP